MHQPQLPFFETRKYLHIRGEGEFDHVQEIYHAWSSNFGGFVSDVDPVGLVKLREHVIA